MAQWQPDQVLDARGLSCPQPVLQARKALRDMSHGQVLEILTTDAGASGDLAAFTARSGDKLLGQEERLGHVSFFLLKC